MQRTFECTISFVRRNGRGRVYDVGKWLVEEFLRRSDLTIFIQTSCHRHRYLLCARKHYEAFAYSPDFNDARSNDAGWLEVADFGLYSPLTLANYGIEYPVVNCGIGVERIAMIAHAFKDIRTLVYPQFYGEFV